MIRLIVISSTIAVIGIYFFTWALLNAAVYAMCWTYDGDTRDDDRFNR